MTIEKLKIPFPDFKIGDQIDPEQFDVNNKAIEDKVNEIIDSQVTDIDPVEITEELTRINSELERKLNITGDFKGTWNGVTMSGAGGSVSAGRLDLLDEKVSDIYKSGIEGIPALQREVANLKLAQAGSDRISGGSVFGDTMLGAPMDMEMQTFRTFILDALSVGVDTLTVDESLGMLIGDSYTIMDDVNKEDVKVANITGNVVQLTTPLTKAFKDGAFFCKSSATLDIRSNELTPIDWHTKTTGDTGRVLINSRRYSTPNQNAQPIIKLNDGRMVYYAYNGDDAQTEIHVSSDGGRSYSIAFIIPGSSSYVNYNYLIQGEGTKFYFLHRAVGIYYFDLNSYQGSAIVLGDTSKITLPSPPTSPTANGCAIAYDAIKKELNYFYLVTGASNTFESYYRIKVREDGSSYGLETLLEGSYGPKLFHNSSPITAHVHDDKVTVVSFASNSIYTVNGSGTLVVTNSILPIIFTNYPLLTFSPSSLVYKTGKWEYRYFTGHGSILPYHFISEEGSLLFLLRNNSTNFFTIFEIKPTGATEFYTISHAFFASKSFIPVYYGGLKFGFLGIITGNNSITNHPTNTVSLVFYKNEDGYLLPSDEVFEAAKSYALVAYDATPENPEDTKMPLSVYQQTTNGILYAEGKNVTFKTEQPTPHGVIRYKLNRRGNGVVAYVEHGQTLTINGKLNGELMSREVSTPRFNFTIKEVY